MRLYHFTCACSVKRINQQGGVLRPIVPWATLDKALGRDGPTGLAGAPTVLWLTDMDVPNVQALGLSSTMLRCDRTEYRYVVETGPRDPVMPWWLYAKVLYQASPRWLSWMQHERDPKRWYVATRALVTGREERTR